MADIVKLLPSDTVQMVSIHIESFPDFFLTKLGREVLLAFYTSLIKDDSTITYGINNNEVLIGFFVASINPKGLYFRMFIKRFCIIIFPLLVSFFHNPRLLIRMIVSIRSSNKLEIPINCNALLLSICVSPDYASKGIGKKLITKLEDELKVHKIDSYFLTTDADNNNLTNNFYIKNDFRLHSTFYQGMRRMNLFIKKLQ